MTEKEKNDYIMKAVDDFLKSAYSILATKEDRKSFDKEFKQKMREFFEKFEKDKGDS